MKTPPLSRRAILRLAGLGSVGAGLTAAAVANQSTSGREPVAAGYPPGDHPHATPASAHAHEMGVVGRVSTEGFDPARFLRSWNFSHLPEPERSRYYRETPRPDGSLLREYEIFAVDREIEIAPGRLLPGLDLQRPGAGPDDPRHRGRPHPHPLRQPGLAPAHPALPRLAPAGDGRLDARAPGGAGRRVPLRVRRRAVRPPPLPLPRRAAEAPHPQGPLRRLHRRPADAAPAGRRDGDGDERLRHQLRRRQRGLRGQHRGALPHAEPIARARSGELVRIYLVNVTEFDLVNSFHLHGMFFDVYRTGTRARDARRSPTR